MSAHGLAQPLPVGLLRKDFEVPLDRKMGAVHDGKGGGGSIRSGRNSRV